MTMIRADSLAQPTIESEEQREMTEDLPVDEIILQHYDRENLPLRRYLKLTGVDEATAQEIVQETFLRLHRHLRGNGDRTNLRAWCYRVAQNLARNEHASARLKRWAPLDEDTLKEVMALLGREREQRLRNAIADLSAAERECLVLRAQGLKYREIAEVLDVSISTAAENVQRAIEKLKESV